MRLKEGDCVRVVVRECTATDKKDGLFCPHYCGLTGTIDKVYDKEVCVKVSLESLPEAILKRHMDVQESIRRKWLNGLSGEAKNRLSAEEKRFELAYTILVQPADLEKTGEVRAVTSGRAAKPPVADAEEDKSPQKPAVEAKSEQKAPSAKMKSVAETPKSAEPKKKTSAKAEAEPKEDATAGLTEAELAFLKEREQALKGKK